MFDPKQPTRFQRGEGKTFKVGRMSMTFTTTAGANWNAYTVCEAIEPPESGAGIQRTTRRSSSAKDTTTFASTESC